MVGPPSSPTSEMHIKVDIPDDLLQQAMRVAERDGRTLDTLIEEGLRAALRRGSWNKPNSQRRETTTEKDAGPGGPPRWGQTGA